MIIFQYPPFVIETKGVGPGFIGYCREIIDVLADQLNFRQVRKKERKKAEFFLVSSGEPRIQGLFLFSVMPFINANVTDISICCYNLSSRYSDATEKNSFQ